MRALHIVLRVVGAATLATIMLTFLISGWWQLPAALAKTDAAEHWASIGGNLSGFGRYLTGQTAPVAHAAPVAAQTPPEPAGPALAPLAFTDFAGEWRNRGMLLSIEPDGHALALLRMGGAMTTSDPTGRMHLVFTHASGRTLYGRVLAAPPGWIASSTDVELTEYADGVAELSESTGAAPATSPRGPRTTYRLCGPRTVDAFACGA